VILVDSSAWIELLRDSGHAARRTLQHHLTKRSEIATTEVVVMELLAGMLSNRTREALREKLLALPLLVVRGLDDFESAADLYRTCRRKGATVRRLTDCLIAAVAIRENVPVLHNDHDFDALARHTKLRVERYVK
jgi:predicted nucleic acid-binding protein